jgi:trans-aconitate methyltransferase
MAIDSFLFVETIRGFTPGENIIVKGYDSWELKEDIMAHDGKQIKSEAAGSWNSEYAKGRYRSDPPVPFIRDIVSAARSANVRCGVYIGCGNGRNYVPLTGAGLKLLGLDISQVAIDQLVDRAPELRDHVMCGDLSSLAPDVLFDLVIAIQVFQHGTRDAAHAHIRLALERVAVNGLFAIRVNAVGTDVELDHEVTERCSDDSFTVRYREGPKNGLEVHFFTRQELNELLADQFSPIVPLRLQTTMRDLPGRGHWSQWEGIWQRNSSPT